MKPFKLLAALILGLLPAMVIAQPAAAHAACTSGWACLHVGANYTGSDTETNALSGTGACVTLSGSSYNNNVESIYGNYVGTGRYISYWNSHNCSGTVVFWSSGGAYASLPTIARNTISSFKRCQGPC